MLRDQMPEALDESTMLVRVRNGSMLSKSRPREPLGLGRRFDLASVELIGVFWGLSHVGVGPNADASD